MDLAVAVYQHSKVFPPDERFGLRLQLRRAAVSVAANIAEGHGRTRKREYARFVLIARGSLKEAETHLYLAQRLGYLRDDDLAALISLATRVNKLITGLHKRLAPR